MLAEELTKNNGGLLPTKTWLVANGHGNILAQLYKFPKAFAHLKREKMSKGGRAKGRIAPFLIGSSAAEKLSNCRDARI